MYFILMSKVSNINIDRIDKLITPNELKIKIPSKDIEELVFNTRNQIIDILNKKPINA